MSFNSGQSFKEMIEAARGVGQEQWPVLEQPFEQVMEQQRERLREVAADWFRAGMSDKELDGQLEELQQQFVAQLSDCAVDEVLRQKVVQAALNCFWEGLMAGL